jgi:glycerol-3-phosphate acyltransferase PlsY
MSVLPWIVVPAAYFIGSIPWGFLVGKATRNVDVREYGSGKTGMANVLRTIGIGGAFIVACGDFAKGAVPVLLIKDSPSLAAAVAIAILIGHNWSIFIKFHGGRGILTGLGALSILVPWASAAALIGLPVIALFRYISLGSLVGTLSTMIVGTMLYLLGQIPTPYALYSLVGGTLIIVQHRENIRRLLKGTELRLGERAAPRS